MSNPMRRIRKAMGLTVPDPGQVGAAAVPAAHTPEAPIRGYDPAEDEVAPDMRPAAEVMPAEVRRWRAPARPGASPAVGPPTDGAGAQPEAHTTAGRPDPRRQWDPGPIGEAGYPGPKEEGLRPSPETLIQTRQDVVIAPSPAPVQVRGGSTGADPARVARMALWLFMRPFDKWSSDPNGVTGYTKIEEASPVASTPIQDSQDVPGAVPSASGRWGARGQQPTGIVPNTTRLVPRSWDELAVQTALTPSPEGARRAGGWRARG